MERHPYNDGKRTLRSKSDAALHRIVEGKGLFMSRSMLRRLLIGGLASVYAIALALAIPLGAAQAHAAYVSSTPAANSVLTKAPTSVSITFAQNLDTKGLSITVYDNTGKVVSTGTALISTTDPKSASISMTGDDSDIYRVDWTTVSAVDGDPTLGAFVFGVDPSGKTDKVPPVASTTPTTSSTGTPAWLAILTGVAGLAVGFFVAALLRNQRTSTAS
jgi:copper resistance protein C